MISGPLTPGAWLLLYTTAINSQSSDIKDHLCPAFPEAKAGTPRHSKPVRPGGCLRLKSSRLNVNASLRAAHSIRQPQWRGYSH